MIRKIINSLKFVKLMKLKIVGCPTNNQQINPLKCRRFMNMKQQTNGEKLLQCFISEPDLELAHSETLQSMYFAE